MFLDANKEVGPVSATEDRTPPPPPPRRRDNILGIVNIAILIAGAKDDSTVGKLETV